MDVLAFVYQCGKHAWKRVFVSDDNTKDSTLQHVFLGIIEDVRSLMVNGSEESPVLDPFELPRLHLELNDPEESYITIEKLEAKQLSTFVVDELNYVIISHRLHCYSVEVECHIPVLEVNAEKYDLEVTSPTGLSVYGTGWFKLKFNEPRIKAKIDFSIDGVKTLTVRNADVVFQLESFEPQITGLYNNLIVNDTVELNLELLVPAVLKVFQNNISEIVNNAIVENGSVELLYGDTLVSKSTIDALKGLELLPS